MVREAAEEDKDLVGVVRKLVELLESDSVKKIHIDEDVSRLIAVIIMFITFIIFIMFIMFTVTLAMILRSNSIYLMIQP